MLCEDKLPESAGDKLTAWGYVDSNFPGETGLDSPGEVLIYWGSIEIYGRTLNFLGNFARRGMHCFVWTILWGIMVYWLCSLVEPTLVPRRIKQLDCSCNSLLPLFLVSPAINSFVLYATIYELANYCQCIYHKLNLGRSSKNKTKKETFGTFNWRYIFIDFWMAWK